MTELEELRLRLIDVEAQLSVFSNNNDTLLGAIVGACIAGVAAYVVYTLQRRNEKHRYELEKLADFVRDLEDVRTMIGNYYSEVKEILKNGGNGTLTRPAHTKALVVPASLNFQAKFGIQIDKFKRENEKFISLGVLVVQNWDKPVTEQRFNINDLEGLFLERQKSFDEMQKAIGKAMDETRNRL